MISLHNASNEKKEALDEMKCQEITKSDGIIMVREELESEGLIAGGGKSWVFGKRMPEAEKKQRREGITDVKEKSREVMGVGMKTEQMKKDKMKLKAGKIIEVVENAKDAEAEQSSKPDAMNDGNALIKVMEENNNPTVGQQPPSSPSAALSSALSKVHISSPPPPPPRLRNKKGDGQGYNRGRERRRGNKSKPDFPEQPKEVPMKNAVMMLNEMFPPPAAAQYKVLSMTGAPNNPTFIMVCCIEGQEFEGSGRSKKEAKLAASQLALSTLFGKVTITHLCHYARLKISLPD